MSALARWLLRYRFTRALGAGGAAGFIVLHVAHVAATAAAPTALGFVSQLICRLP